jgi:hypothetical protein
MKIRISKQHLAGNDPSGFDSARWVEALEIEYRKAALEHYPDAEIEVDIEFHRMSGIARQLSAEIDGVPDEQLYYAMTAASMWLYERHGQEYFKSHNNGEVSK